MNDNTLVIKKIFNAPAEKVFAAWTDPDMVKKWYGPEGMTTDIHEMDVREGGVYRLTMKSPDGAVHPLRGTFTAIQRPTRLEMTWQWESEGAGDEEGPETTVKVELVEKEGKTEMTLTHELTSKEACDMHQQGWESSFTKLEKILV